MKRQNSILLAAQRVRLRARTAVPFFVILGAILLAAPLAHAQSDDPTYTVSSPSGVSWPLTGSNSGSFGGLTGLLSIGSLSSGTQIFPGVYTFNQAQLRSALSGQVEFENVVTINPPDNKETVSSPFNVFFNASYPDTSADSSNAYPTLTNASGGAGGLLFLTSQGIFLGPNSALTMGGLENSPKQGSSDPFDSITWTNTGSSSSTMTLHRDTYPNTGTISNLTNSNWQTQMFSATTAWEIAAVVPEPSTFVLVALGAIGTAICARRLR